MIEFALLAVPFFAIVGATLETAVVFLASEVLDTAVHDANRLILTGQAQDLGFDIDDYRARVCDRTFGMFDCSAIHIQVTPVVNFASASVTPPIETNCQNTCQWTEQQNFMPGQGSSVVLVRAYYKWPIVLDFFGVNLATLPDRTRLLASVRVFRNEPFT